MLESNADRIACEYVFVLVSLASGTDSESFFEPISQALQAPMTLFSVASGMCGSLALLWWNKQRTTRNIEAFEHRMSDRLEDMREHESHLSH